MDKIIIHCSDTPDEREVSAATIHGWHVSNGWDGIGYHSVILRDGSIEQGRPWYWQGSHTKEANNDSIGICLIGRSYYTDLQLLALKALLYQMCFIHQGATIHGHNEFNPKKTCPNFNVKAWVAENMPGINDGGP